MWLPSEPSGKRTGRARAGSTTPRTVKAPSIGIRRPSRNTIAAAIGRRPSPGRTSAGAPTRVGRTSAAAEAVRAAPVVTGRAAARAASVRRHPTVLAVATDREVVIDPAVAVTGRVAARAASVRRRLIGPGVAIVAARAVAPADERRADSAAVPVVPAAAAAVAAVAPSRAWGRAAALRRTSATEGRRAVRAWARRAARPRDRRAASAAVVAVAVGPAAVAAGAVVEEDGDEEDRKHRHPAAGADPGRFAGAAEPRR